MDFFLFCKSANSIFEKGEENVYKEIEKPWRDTIRDNDPLLQNVLLLVSRPKPDFEIRHICAVREFFVSYTSTEEWTDDLSASRYQKSFISL